jgi:sec-independent protein translocase protein TatA
MGEFSLMHIIFFLAVLLIFFGPSKLPGLGKSMGEAIRGFKKGLNVDEKEETSAQREQLASAEKKREQEALEKEKSRS